jgi:hypothetical protein
VTMAVAFHLDNFLFCIPIMHALGGCLHFEHASTGSIDRPSIFDLVANPKVFFCHYQGAE